MAGWLRAWLPSSVAGWLAVQLACAGWYVGLGYSMVSGCLATFDCVATDVWLPSMPMWLPVWLVV